MEDGRGKPNGDASWDEDGTTGSELPPSGAGPRRAQSATGGENSSTDGTPQVPGLESRTEVGSPTRIRRRRRSFGATTDSDPTENGDEDGVGYPLVNRVRRVIRTFRITREGEDVH